MKGQSDRQNKSKSKKILLIIISSILVVIIIGGVICYNNFFMPMSKYQNAIELKEKGDYDNSISAFEDLGDYQDSKDQIKEVTYLKGLKALKQGNYEKAIELFGETDYSDSDKKIKTARYKLAKEYYDNGFYENAMNEFDSLGSYKKSVWYYNKCCNSVVRDYIIDNGLKKTVTLSGTKFNIEMTAGKKKTILLSLTMDEDDIPTEMITPVITIDLDATKSTNKFSFMILFKTDNGNVYDYTGDGIISPQTYTLYSKLKYTNFKSNSSIVGLSQNKVKELVNTFVGEALSGANKLFKKSDLSVNMESFGYTDLD